MQHRVQRAHARSVLIALAVLPRGRRRAGLSDAQRHHPGAVRAGRRHRPAGARGRAEARAAARQAVRHREPPRRRHRDRRRRNRQGRARRLHADAGDQRHHGDESAPSSKACPTTPAKDLVPVALIAGVPFVLVVNPIAAGAQRRRSGEARQGEAADLRLRRRRRVPSSQRRAVQQHDRHQDDARSLQGQRAGA